MTKTETGGCRQTAISESGAFPAWQQGTCMRCQGNGEIVIDWDRYMKPLPGDVGDEAVAECPDCDGSGFIPLPPAPSAQAGEVVDRLYDDNAPMADGEVRMTAAESVLAWLLVEKIGVPDDVSYTPKAAQETIAKTLDRAKELYEIDAMLREGQGDDDGAQILPDFKAGMSVSAKVEACLFLLEKRRDVIEAFTNKAPDDAMWAAEQELVDALAFYDKVKSASFDEQIAVGQDHSNRLFEATRAMVTLICARKGGAS